MSFSDARRRALTLLVAPLLLAGCTLIDQRSFNPNAGRPPVPPKPKTVARTGPPPLLTIAYDDPTLDWRPALRVAVTQALQAKPDVLFDVVTLVPPSASNGAGLAGQVAAARSASESGQTVAEAIAADGADIGQVELSARVDPSVAARTVRVYVH